MFEIVLTRSIILVLFTGPPLLVSRVNPFRDKRQAGEECTGRHTCLYTRLYTRPYLYTRLYTRLLSTG